MKQPIVLAFFLMIVSQNAGAVEAGCQEKLRLCKSLWQKVEINKAACQACLQGCVAAQKACKDELPSNAISANNNLTTANAYLLGCKQACRN